MHLVLFFFHPSSLTRPWHGQKCNFCFSFKWNIYRSAQADFWCVLLLWSSNEEDYKLSFQFEKMQTCVNHLEKGEMAENGLLRDLFTLNSHNSTKRLSYSRSMTELHGDDQNRRRDNYFGGKESTQKQQMLPLEDVLLHGLGHLKSF